MADEARARREWIRRNHPDAGGDPGRFAEGLAGFAKPIGTRPGPGRPRVRVVQRESWLQRLWRRVPTRRPATRRSPNTRRLT